MPSRPSRLALSLLVGAGLVACSSDDKKKAKITDDEMAHFLAGQIHTRGKTSAEVLGQGQSVNTQPGLDVKDAFRIKDGAMSDAELKEALAKAKPGDRAALQQRQAEILKNRSGIASLKADDMVKDEHRSSVYAKTTTAELIATLENLSKPGADAHATETISIIFEALRDPRRKDGIKALPMLAKYLDDKRPAYFEAVASKESEQSHQRWFYENVNQFEPMTLGLYAALHMQMLANAQPKNVDFKIHASGIYLAQSGPFAVNSADLLKAWKDWWAAHKNDYTEDKK